MTTALTKYWPIKQILFTHGALVGTQQARSFSGRCQLAQFLILYDVRAWTWPKWLCHALQAKGLNATRVLPHEVFSSGQLVGTVHANVAYELGISPHFHPFHQLANNRLMLL